MQTQPYFECDGMVNDLFLVVDQDQVGCEDVGDLMQQHVPMQHGLERSPSLQSIDWLLDVPESTLPSISLDQAQLSSMALATAVPSRAIKQGRRCTSLAQREAHKRYRERKKLNIAAMETAIQNKRKELQQLQEENEQLKSKARVLETAERCSTEIHELMKLLGGLQFDMRSKGASQTSAADNHGSSSSSLPRSPGSSCVLAAIHPGSPSSSSHGSLHAVSGSVGASIAGVSYSAPLCTLLQGLGDQHGDAGKADAAVVIQNCQQQLCGDFLNLQDQAHWLQLARQYIEGIQLQLSTVTSQASVPCGGRNGTSYSAIAKAAAETAVATAGQDAGAEVASTGQMYAVPSLETEPDSVLLTEMGSVATPEEGLVVYKAFLNEASKMLVLKQHQEQVGSIEETSRLERQLDELTRSSIGRLQPFLVARGQGVVYEWNARNLETLQHEEPPQTLWPAVLEALHLSEQAQSDALQCFELFSRPLSDLLEERMQLVQLYKYLQQTSPQNDASCSSNLPVNAAGDSAPFDAGQTLEPMADTHYSSVIILKALAANLERYQTLDGVFAHSLTSLLSGAQIAAACVASFPYLPRWHTMMTVLQQHRQDLEQQQHLCEQASELPVQPLRRSSRVKTTTLSAKDADV